MISFGLVGCGHIGMRHARLLEAHPDTLLVAVCDIRPERMSSVAGTWPDIRTSPEFKLLVKDPDIDIISICTPNGLHAPQAIEALYAGKHVLVEKPMAIRVTEADAMIRASQESGRSLFVVKQNRFNPPVQAVRQLIDQHKLGKIYTVSVNCYWNRSDAYYRQSDWKGTSAMDGGTLFTQFSHFIDILYYLFGDLDVLHAIFDNVSHPDTIEFEDTGVVNFSLRHHHALGTLHYTTSSFKQNMEGSITVFAEHATIKIGGRYLNTIAYQCTDGFDIEGLPDSGPANDYGYYEGSMSNHDKVIQNVVRSLQGKEEIMTNALDGRMVVDIIERMYAAGKKIRSV